MPGTKTFILNVIASTCLLAQTDYFPLQTEINGFIRQRRAPSPWKWASQSVQGNDYFLVKGLPSTPEVLLRKDGAGRILMFDAQAKQERVWLDSNT